MALVLSELILFFGSLRVRNVIFRICNRAILRPVYRNGAINRRLTTSMIFMLNRNLINLFNQ